MDSNGPAVRRDNIRIPKYRPTRRHHRLINGSRN